MCAVLAGGNVDATTMSSVIRYGFGVRAVPRRRPPDPRPAGLARIVAMIADQRANVLAIQRHREEAQHRARDRGGADARDPGRGASQL